MCIQSVKLHVLEGELNFPDLCCNIHRAAECFPAQRSTFRNLLSLTPLCAISIEKRSIAPSEREKHPLTQHRGRMRTLDICCTYTWGLSGRHRRKGKKQVTQLIKNRKCEGEDRRRFFVITLLLTGPVSTSSHSSLSITLNLVASVFSLDFCPRLHCPPMSTPHLF